MPQRFLADHAARQRIRLEWRTFASFYCLPLFKGCPILSLVLLKPRLCLVKAPLGDALCRSGRRAKSVHTGAGAHDLVRHYALTQ